MVARSGQADYRAVAEAYHIGRSCVMWIRSHAGLYSSFQAFKTAVTSVITTETRKMTIACNVLPEKFRLPGGTGRLK